MRGLSTVRIYSISQSKLYTIQSRTGCAIDQCIPDSVFSQVLQMASSKNGDLDDVGNHPHLNLI